MAHFDIITPDEIKRDAINSLSIDVTDATSVSGIDGSYKEVAEQLITDTSRLIDSYLNKRVIVDRYQPDIYSDLWEYDSRKGKYFYYATYPVVQVDTTGCTISNDKLRILSGEVENELDYYAGYKRSDQTLSDLQSQFASLTGTPDNLPDDIRRVCQKIVMFELDMAINNTYAQSSRTQTMGNATSEITRLQTDFVESELGKLYRYKQLAI